MNEFTFNYNEAEGLATEQTKSYIRKGGFYTGKILTAEIKHKGEGITLEIECITKDGDSTGKSFLVLQTKEGKQVDKNGNPLSGRGMLNAILKFTQVRTITTGAELMGKQISFLGCMKNSEKDGKHYQNFTILNFMSAVTSQTLTEMVQNKPATRCDAVVKDDEPVNSTDHQNINNESKTESDLPF